MKHIDINMFESVYEAPTLQGSAGYTKREFRLRNLRAFVETYHQSQEGGWTRKVHKVRFNDGPQAIVHKITPQEQFEFTDEPKAVAFAMSTLVLSVMHMEELEDARGEAVFEDRD